MFGAPFIGMTTTGCGCTSVGYIVSYCFSISFRSLLPCSVHAQNIAFVLRTKLPYAAREINMKRPAMMNTLPKKIIETMSKLSVVSRIVIPVIKNIRPRASEIGHAIARHSTNLGENLGY